MSPAIFIPDPGTTWRSGAGVPSNSLGSEGDYYLRTANGDVYQKASSAYTVVANLTGPAGADGAVGETGPAGADGAAGTLWATTAGAPTNGLGEPWARHLNTTNGDIYSSDAAITWTLVGNLKGPIGATGAAGTNGAPGAVWRNGSGVPANGTGIDGDYYLNTTNGDVYQRASGTYSVIGNIKGAAGAAGTNGTNGTNGSNGAPGSVWRNGSGAPSNGTGIDGDYYLNTTNGDVYQRASGTYSVIGNIKGAAGAAGAQGDPGPGVPAGGTAGQILSKVNGTDYNTEWVNNAGGGGTVEAIGLTGTQDGVNKVFTLAQAVSPALVIRNGQILAPGASEDYVISGTTLTFQAGYPAPLSTDKLLVYAVPEVALPTVQYTSPPPTSSTATGTVGQRAIDTTNKKIFECVATNTWIRYPYTAFGTVERTYVSDGDTNGVMYFAGTYFGEAAWANPASLGVVPIVRNNEAVGNASMLVDRSTASETYQDNTANNFIAMDMGGGRSLVLKKYTLRLRTVENARAIRNWKMQGTNTLSSFSVADIAAATWTDIDVRSGDTTMPATAGAWALYTLSTTPAAYRYLRLLQTGTNSSGDLYVTLTDLELYGTFTY